MIKHCKKCGTLYIESSGCPKCSTAVVSKEETPMPDDQINKKRKRDWLTIFIGVPLLIAFIYLIIYFMFLLKQ